MRLIIYIAMLVFSVKGFAQTDSLFEKGKEFYKAEKYQEAIDTWAKILGEKSHSAELYYNLGNACYKLNKIGPSIYYYEKALQLSPNDKDIKNNLAFAQNATIDAIEPLPESVFTKWYNSLFGIFSFEGWAWLSAIFAVVFMILFMGYYLSYSENKKRFLFTGFMISLGIMILSFLVAMKKYNDVKNSHPAIIFEEQIEARSGPSLGSDETFILHEGTKVDIIARDEDWVRIVIANGKDGWVPLESLKEL